MAIDSGTIYWLMCDVCGDTTDTESADVEFVKIKAQTEEKWLITDDRHLCPECREGDDDG